MKPILFSLFSLLFAGLLQAQLPALSERIHVDQFGYRTTALKTCFISDPQTGFNAAESFSPGANYQVRRWSDQVSVFSAAITAWNGGATHSQSGDKVWWFVFTDLTTPGDYYVYDPTNNVRSQRFTIADDVYNEALKQASRMFFLQRCGTAKSAAHAGDWNDPVCHTHALQDLNCRSVSTPNDPASEKDLSGGWHDAGDYNKYINFTYSTVHDLLFAYQQNPAAFGDNNGIPESGNGIPDLLDEIKYELDWMAKMQLANGSVLMKVSVTDFSAASPASADLPQRVYAPAQASATRTLCSVFAHAAVVYASLGNPAMTTYANTLLTKSQLAWDWINLNPATSNYNNAGFQNVSSEVSADEQNETRTGAAAFLFAATGNTTYRTYFDNNYTAIRPYSWTYWYPFQSTIQDVMLFYASLPNATAAVANNIRSNCTTSVNTNNADLLPAWLAQSDAYRAYLKNSDYVWGSNRVKASTGSIFYNMVVHNLSPANHTQYRNAAEQYVHFLHGANPINKAMLTNMGGHGAENSCDEMYHGWFGNGTAYDNAQTSLYGPPPGFLTGGFNPSFAPDGACGCTIAPPQNQPIQKSYKDWNTSWPENSWEITEPAIYYNAGYIKLLSKFAAAAPTAPACTSLTNPSHGATGVPANTTISWAAASGSPTGYRISIGTTPGGTDLANNLDVGNVTTYDPPGFLPYGTAIYVTIKPYNSTGEPSTCTEQAFTTANCLPGLQIVQVPVPAGDYRSLGELVSNNSTIANGTVVTFRSDTGVLLDQNFVVEQGGVFEVIIQDCTVQMRPGKQ